MTPTATEIALADVFRSFAADPDDARIPGFARSLAIAAAIHNGGERAQNEREGSDKERDRLRQMERHAQQLSADVEALDRKSYVLLGKHLQAKFALDPDMLVTILERVAALAVEFDQAIADRPAEPPRSGKPTLKAAPAITPRAARIYESLTGKRPTRVNRQEKSTAPFVAYLERVFQVLGIKGSADDQARKLQQSVEKSPVD